MAESDRIRPMAARDLPQVLAWRNHIEVRRYMFTQHEITPAEHHAWFERASVDASRQLLVVEAADGPFGMVQFAGVAPGGTAHWGFYVQPLAPAGNGRRLGRLALDHAFGVLQLGKVCGQALASNHRSQAFHLRLGFSREGEIERPPAHGNDLQIMVCFGLEAATWTATRPTEKGSHALV